MLFKKKSEETFCVRDRYTKSAKPTSFIQCKKIIKTVVLNEKLTNIEPLNLGKNFRPALRLWSERPDVHLLKRHFGSSVAIWLRN